MGDFIYSVVTFVSTLPSWVWALFLAVGVGLLADYIDDTFYVKITLKVGQQYHLSTIVGIGLIVVAGALAMVGPNILWMLGGTGLGLYLGRHTSKVSVSTVRSTRSAT